MPLQFDSSRAPLTASDFKSLVLAVQGAGKGDEAEWIEWKSSLNLVTKEGLAAVARAIVGLANRVLPAATVHCEGRAYVLVGVEPGEKVAGIDEVDPAVVEDRLRPYLGDDGPRWAPHWVRIDGKSVLVIEVAAARDGDLIHHIRKQGPNVLDGEVFIRRGAKTLNPSSAELRALLRRYKALSNLHGLRVSLSEPSEIPVVDFSDVAIEKWIDEARTSLLRSLDQFNSRPQRDLDTLVTILRKPSQLGRRSLKSKNWLAARKLASCYLKTKRRDLRRSSGPSRIWFLKFREPYTGQHHGRPKIAHRKITRPRFRSI